MVEDSFQALRKSHETIGDPGTIWILKFHQKIQIASLRIKVFPRCRAKDFQTHDPLSLAQIPNCIPVPGQKIANYEIHASSIITSHSVVNINSRKGY